MNIFGDKIEKDTSSQCPQCPRCKGKIVSMIDMSVKGNWIEYVCTDCRKVCAIKDNEIKIMGVG